MEKSAQTPILYTFYSDLYDEKSGIEIKESTFIPKLNDDQRDLCEGQLTYSESYKVLSTFKNKTKLLEMTDMTDLQ